MNEESIVTDIVYQSPNEILGNTNTYPPKFIIPSKPENLWAKSAISLLLYLVAGYFFFQDYHILILITAVVLIHELGHFIAMKMFGYSDVSIFFIPLLGAYVSGNKREISQKQSAIILLAGPVPGIVIGILLLWITKQTNMAYWGGFSLHIAGIIFLLLNVLNLLPVYPLDGGQLLNRIFLEEDSMVSKIFVIISALLMCVLVWAMYRQSHSPTSFVLLIFPLHLLMRHFSQHKMLDAEKKIEAAGINTDVVYADLPDEHYWQIRDILINTQPHLSKLKSGAPYIYAANEERMVSLIQACLHRHLLQDVTITQKLLIMIVWLGALLSPWLFALDIPFFTRLFA
jgi:Zn-dependent protease